MLLRSDSLFNIGKYDESMRLLSELTSGGYKHPAIFTKKGIIYLLKGDTLSAMKNFNLATSLDPTYPHAYEYRAAVFQRQGNFVQALYDLNALVKLRSNDKRVLMVRAGIKHSLNKFSEALQDYDLSIQIDPNWDTSYVMKARAVFFETDSSSKGILVLDQCLKNCPKSVYALETRVNMLIYAKRFNEVVSDLDQLLQIAPQNSGSYFFARGKAKYKLADSTGACEDMERARQNKNPDALMWMNSNCKNLVKNSDFTAEALALEAEAFMRKAMYVSAIEKLDSAIKVKPNEHRYFFMRGMSQYFLKKHELATADLNKALEIKPGDQSCYYYLTLCEIAMQHPEQARSYAQEAVKYGEDYKCFQVLTTLCIDTKDFVCAEKNLRSAIRLRPEDSQLYMIAGEMYTMMNNPNKACEAYRKAKALGDGRAIVKVVMNCN